uniref:RING-type E3 ubiquitin transferase n=1 Tax=Opuntia streptacantha TaxID=393608 RepID=A0A7C8YYJ3_OPUST
MNEVGEYGVLEAIRDLEWEIMLALDNFRREMQDMDFDGEAYGMDFNEDAYEAIFREMEDRMSEWRRSPPTAKSVVENLPTLRLSAECLEENDVCAICKDDILGQGTVRQLPCLHYYHGDCILPWLKMHNTCPLCRHELPTDDLEYEYMKREREGLSLHGDVSVDARSGYDFHTFL